MSYIALPPGIYNIQSKDTKNVANPGTNGDPLFVETPSTATKQQWLISGNGIQLALDVGTYSYADLSQSGTPLQVKRNNSAKVEWIIKVEANIKDKNYSGVILTNDNTKRYWGLNKNNVGEFLPVQWVDNDTVEIQVQLQDASYTWKFVPV